MCGIAGFWSESGGDPQAMHQLAAAMGDAIAHRGPDDWGVWCDAGQGLALAARRLAIIDLSPAGHQPMASADGRVVVAFNGEIYNHRALRSALEAEGVRFRSRSDTEVLVEAAARWGVERTLAALNGMFAFALWETDLRRLTLARDRLGEKPLYWSRRGGLLIFGSELKALRRHPGFDGTPDRAAVAALLRLGYVPAPLCIHAHVRQLEPGCALRFDSAGAPSLLRYWSAEEAALQGLAEPLRGSDDDILAEGELLVREAVTSRLESDVPLGLFLSGGIDSSTVAAMIQAAGAGPVHSFSIGFAERGFDEAEDARRIAAHLGTRHDSLVVTAEDALAVIPDLPRIYDEPFADSSQVPTYLLCRLARPAVTVALSGDGGDEVFAGYSRHLWADRVGAARTVPRLLRRAAAAALRGPGPAQWDRAAALLPWQAPRQFGDKVHKTAAALVAEAGTLYADLAGAGRNDGVAADEVPGALAGWLGQETLGLPLDDVQLMDMRHYLSGDILTKVDRASMAVSLELRAPFLDHRLVEFAWRLPRRMKVRDGKGKWLLRRILDRHVPPALVDRPKSGFTLPLADWLRGPLRDWAAALLRPDRLEGAGLRAPAVMAAWQRHQAQTGNEAEALWAVLMLLAWSEAQPAASL